MILERHLAQLTKPKQKQQQQLTTSKPNPFEDNNVNTDDDDEEAFRWDESKPLMGTGRLLLQDPEQSSSSSSSPFPFQSSSASPPPPSRFIISVPLHPEPTSSSLLTKPTTMTGSGNGAPANYGSITITAPAANNPIGTSLQGDVGNPKLAFCTTDESTTENDDDNDDDPHETDPLQASSQPSESTGQQQSPQRPCFLQIVYAFETFAILASLAWWLTEILLPLVVLRSHALEETPIVTIILLSYMSVLVLLLGLVESRRPCACCCGLLQSPVLQAPIYRGFWYSLVGCIGLNLANDEYQLQQQQHFVHEPLEDSYHNITATLSFSWFWQVSWSSWLFLQVLSSIMMILVGWIYILAGLLCFACGECFERSRREHEEERNKFQKQQHQQQTQPQSNKAKSK